MGSIGRVRIGAGRRQSEIVCEGKTTAWAKAGRRASASPLNIERNWP